MRHVRLPYGQFHKKNDVNDIIISWPPLLLFKSGILGRLSFITPPSSTVDVDGGQHHYGMSSAYLPVQFLTKLDHLSRVDILSWTSWAICIQYCCVGIGSERM